jgi:hypothetical protein
MLLVADLQVSLAGELNIQIELKEEAIDGQNKSFI